MLRNHASLNIGSAGLFVNTVVSLTAVVITALYFSAFGQVVIG